MPKKNYVFDTNVLIHDPKSIFRFQDNDIYIPIYVLEELDGLKNDPGQKGAMAREAIRMFDDLRSAGKLTEGVNIHKDNKFLPEGMDPLSSGKLYIYAPSTAALTTGVTDIIDNNILQSCIQIKANSTNRTIFVTMDVNLRVRAEALDVQVAQYEFQSVDINSLGNEVKNIEISSELIDNLFKDESIDLESIGIDEFDLNSSVVASFGKQKSALCRVYEEMGKKVIRKITPPRSVMGIKPKNVEQSFALDLLLNESIQLVTLMGKAGCGKTLLALLAGIYQVTELGLYNKLIISRPPVEMGKGIGFLPGSMEEKMGPYMQPFYDNLDYIMMSSGGKSKNKIDDLFKNGTIQMEPLTFIRGRSMPNQFIIVDETQNISYHEAKTIITRCGEGTKLVFTGDIHQIDNPYISSSTNGLSVTAKKLRDNYMTGHIALEKGERSALATLAATEM